MPDNDKMQRVSKANPCPICGKPDWCLVSPDMSAAICARIRDDSVKRCGDAGWLHMLRGNVHNVHNVHRQNARRCRLLTRLPVRESPTSNFKDLVQQYQQQLTTEKLRTLAGMLGVSGEGLRRLGVGWDGQACTFPMSDADGKIIGIRRRFANSRKCSVLGSRTGLFMPSRLSDNGLLLIVEGPTDTAAALELGFDAVGRPNCNSKVAMAAKAARGRSEIAIVGDNDSPGREGARKLAAELVLHCPTVKVVYPPNHVKDLRQWLREGLEHRELQQIMDGTECVKIGLHFEIIHSSTETDRWKQLI